MNTNKIITMSATRRTHTAATNRDRQATDIAVGLLLTRPEETKRSKYYDELDRAQEAADMAAANNDGNAYERETTNALNAALSLRREILGR